MLTKDKNPPINGGDFRVRPLRAALTTVLIASALIVTGVLAFNGKESASAAGSGGQTAVSSDESSSAKISHDSASAAGSGGQTAVSPDESSSAKISHDSASAPAFSLLYDETEGTRFCLYNDYLAECSRDSFCLIDKNGFETFHKSVDFSAPAMCARGGYLVAYDCGGRTAFAMKGRKTVWEETFANAISGASVNKNGYIALILDEVGYRNCVRVYAPVGKKLFDWFVADDYVVGSEVAPSGKELIINRLKTSGLSARSSLVYLDMKYEPFRTVESKEDEVYLGARYLDDNTLAVATKNSLYLYSEAGELLAHEEFDYLTAFCEFPAGRVVAAVHRNNRELLIEYSADAPKGNALVIADRPVRNLSADNGFLFINYGYSAEVLGANGKTASRLAFDDEILYGGASAKIGILAVAKKSADIYAFQER